MKSPINNILTWYFWNDNNQNIVIFIGKNIGIFLPVLVLE